MKSKALAGARRLYVDSNVIIYFIDGDETTQRLAGRLFEYAEKRGIELVTSEITVGECLYGAHKLGRGNSVARFESLFEDMGFFRLVPVELDILEAAARFGPAHRMKLIDAIHVVSGIEERCDAFVTNDRGIKSTEALRVVQLPDV